MIQESQAGVTDVHKPDAVVILGDLNYRLRYTEGGMFPLGDREAMAKLIYTRAGRAQMAFKDPLNPEGDTPMDFVKPRSEPGGMGFRCNKGYAASFPTYKLDKDHKAHC